VIERVSQQADRTPDQVLALANASARAGDFAAALSLYRAYMRTTPFEVKVANDYAGVLGMNLDEQGFEELKAQFAANQAGSDIPAAENNYELGLRAALQTNLYNGRFEDAIQAGERLIGRQGDRTDAWVHLWLACAYGQRHRRFVGSRAGDTEAETRAKAVEQVVKAVEKDRGMIPYIRTLYLPGQALGLDNDLESLHPDPVLEELMGQER
jgi:tetratricopeptide (TPR) repeat protein